MVGRGDLGREREEEGSGGQCRYNGEKPRRNGEGTFQVWKSRGRGG